MDEYVISPELEQQLLALIAQKKPVSAMHLLERQTGMEYLDCSAWVKDRIPYKEWYPNKYGPIKPCQYCGESLKTSLVLRQSPKFGLA